MRDSGDAPREVTVSDVAALARVSKATAARALGEYGAVSDGVRDRVHKAAEQLGYRPNALARTMSTGRSLTLGIVVGDIENPFFAQATRGASDVAVDAGYDLILSNSDENVEREAKALGVHLAKRVDGLLVAPASSLVAGNLQQVVDARRPLVLFDRTVDGLDVDAVITSNRRGARTLTELLLGAGHRRIAFVSTIRHGAPYRMGDVLTNSAVRDRVQGFTETLAAAGTPRPEQFVHLDARSVGLDALVQRILGHQDRATAVIASDSLIALAIFRTAQRLGVSLPEDLSLVSFDDADWMSLTAPGITAMAQPIHEIGAEATRALLRRIGGDRSPHVTTVLDQCLIQRSSVAAPPRSPR